MKDTIKTPLFRSELIIPLKKKASGNYTKEVNNMHFNRKGNKEYVCLSLCKSTCDCNAFNFL